MVSRKKTARKKTAKPDKKTIMILAVIAVVVIIAISIFLITKPEDTGADGADSRSTAAAGSPEDMYLKYKREFDASNNFDDYANVVRRYGTSGEIAEITEYELLSDVFKKDVFDLVKSLAPSYSDLDIENIQESIDGNSAILIVDTKDRTMMGTIKLRKQGGIWKIEDDSWKEA
jgi:hypothetical protein